jgi:hypothetical protein
MPGRVKSISLGAKKRLRNQVVVLAQTLEPITKAGANLQRSGGGTRKLFDSEESDSERK